MCYTSFQMALGKVYNYQFGFTGFQSSSTANGLRALIDQGSAQTYNTGRLASTLGPTKK